MTSKSFFNEKNKLYQFINCQLLKDHKIVKEDLWVKNGLIQDPTNIFFDQKVKSEIVVDCKGCYIFPGLIDLQINGAFGYDFSYDADKISQVLEKVSCGLLQYGVTSFCPTIITSAPEVYEKILSTELKKERSHGADVLGFHLEGPFISPRHQGAHPTRHLCPIHSEAGGRVADLFMRNTSKISIVTLAPELEGAMEMVEEFVEKGVVVSMGHSAADLEEGVKAVRRGASFVTHLFNAMLPFHHRDPHLIGLLVSEDLHYGVIADGIHTHPAALSLAYNTSPAGMVLVTDAVSALGLPEGLHHLGDMKVEVRGDKALIAGTDVLCGSLTPLNKCLKFFNDNVSHDLVASVEAATLQPARVLGLERQIGSLGYGCHANLVLWDTHLEPMATLKRGVVAWKHENFELLCTQR